MIKLRKLFTTQFKKGTKLLFNIAAKMLTKNKIKL